MRHSWAALGPLLGRSWALLGRSWALLGRSWGALGRSWALLGAPRSILARFWSSRESILVPPGMDFRLSEAVGVVSRELGERVGDDGVGEVAEQRVRWAREERGVAGRQTDTRCEAKARRVDPSRSLPDSRRQTDTRCETDTQTDRHTLRSKRSTSRPESQAGRHTHVAKQKLDDLTSRLSGRSCKRPGQRIPHAAPIDTLRLTDNSGQAKTNKLHRF